MQTQTEFKMHPFSMDTHLVSAVDLINYCEDADSLEEGYRTPEWWRTWLSDPEVDIARDVRIWQDEAGRVVAYAQTRIPLEEAGGNEVSEEPPDELPVILYLRVHPETRGIGIEEQALEWGYDTIRRVARERGKQKPLARMGLHITSPEYIAYRQGLLEANGFEPVRYWFKMARPLNEPIPEPQMPDGFTVRENNKEEDQQRWVDMFNQTFIDHWDHHPLTLESQLNWHKDPAYRPELDLLAIAPDGTFAAFCVCMIFPEDNAHKGRNEGWIDSLGTRRGYRKIGLGRAMLILGMLKLKSEGVDTAVLGVDANNPTGALRLYESVGFTSVNRTVTYEKKL